MKNISLTTNSGERKVLVNWDNVNFAKDTVSQFGDNYTEVNFGRNHHIDVSETIKEVNKLLLELWENDKYERR